LYNSNRSAFELHSSYTVVTLMSVGNGRTSVVL